MAEVSVIVNGRSYHMACEDGQETHLRQLAASLDTQVSELVKTVGQIGDARLLVIAALMMADEAHELRGEIDELRDDMDLRVSRAEDRPPPR